MELDADEKINAIIPVREFDDKHYLVMATKAGTIKKTNLIEFSNPRKGGIAAINLDESVKDALTADLKQFFTDWNTFYGKTVYDLSSMNPTGCLKPKLTEAEAAQ